MIYVLDHITENQAIEIGILVPIIALVLIMVCTCILIYRKKKENCDFNVSMTEQLDCISQDKKGE